MTVPQYAPQAPTLGAQSPRPRNLLWAAAQEPRAADAVVLLTKALGLDEIKTDVAGFFLPLDDGRKWKQAPTTLRLIMIGQWLHAEAYAVADHIEKPVQFQPMANHSSE